MKPNLFFSRLQRSPRITRAFTLVEIMIAVTLMSVIVIGLMAMFTQTQRAFRLGMNQTDVLESGRIVTDLLVREMEQITPTGKGYQLPPSLWPEPPNFYVQLVSAQNGGLQLLPSADPINPVFRTNMMSDLFFVSRENQTWTGIGYFVRTNVQVLGSYGPVGTLYRFQTNSAKYPFDRNPFSLWDGFNRARSGQALANVSKVLDGVVHFHARAYDSQGVQVVPQNYMMTNAYYVSPNTNIARFAFASTLFPGEFNYAMPSNVVPAYVELEIGILEQQSYERYEAIGNATRKGNYYTNRAGNVHLFRQRIPIRNVDLSAYQ